MKTDQLWETIANQSTSSDGYDVTVDGATTEKLGELGYNIYDQNRHCSYQLIKLRILS